MFDQKFRTFEAWKLPQQANLIAQPTTAAVMLEELVFAEYNTDNAYYENSFPSLQLRFGTLMFNISLYFII